MYYTPYYTYYTLFLLSVCSYLIRIHLSIRYVTAKHYLYTLKIYIYLLLQEDPSQRPTMPKIVLQLTAVVEGMRKERLKARLKRKAGSKKGGAGGKGASIAKASEPVLDPEDTAGCRCVIC
jgi:hypothetical protein